MKFALAVMWLVGISGFSKLEAAQPPLMSSSVNVSKDAEALPEGMARTGCPQKWTCSGRSWYDTEAACRASSCGSGCSLEYLCHPGCICP